MMNRLFFAILSMIMITGCDPIQKAEHKDDASGITIWQDNDRGNVCYLYASRSISCVKEVKNVQ